MFERIKELIANNDLNQEVLDMLFEGDYNQSEFEKYDFMGFEEI